MVEFFQEKDKLLNAGIQDMYIILFYFKVLK